MLDLPTIIAGLLIPLGFFSSLSSSQPVESSAFLHYWPDNYPISKFIIKSLWRPIPPTQPTVTPPWSRDEIQLVSNPSPTSTPAVTIAITPSPATIITTPIVTLTIAPTAAPSSKPSPVPTLATSQIIPSATKAPAPTKVPVIPTKVPTVAPTARPLPTATPVPVQTDNSFIGQINSYRQANGKSPVRSDSHTCNFARTRAQEITSGFNHDGFTNRLNSKTLPYPSYSLVTENLARTSDSSRVVQMWIDSPGHAANMLKDTPYVCVEQNGDYYAYEGWKP